MLRRVNRRALVKRLCVLAALAGAAVCALEGFPDAAAGVDGGEPVAAAAPETETGPGPAGIPDAGSGLLSRRRFRRWKRMGVPGVPDGGIPAWRDAGAPRDAGHDLVARGAFVPRVVTPPVVAPPPAPPVPSTPSTSQPVTDLGFNTCQKIPRGKRAVKLNLKPEVELPELVAWILVGDVQVVRAAWKSQRGRQEGHVRHAGRDDTRRGLRRIPERHRLDRPHGRTSRGLLHDHRVVEGEDVVDAGLRFRRPADARQLVGLGRLTGPAAHDFRAFRGANRHLAAVVRRVCRGLPVAIVVLGVRT